MKFDLMIDTDVAVDILRGVPESLDWLKKHSDNSIALSVFSAMEILLGASSKNEVLELQGFVDFFGVVQCREEMTATAYKWFREYHLGHGIGILDCCIGAAALHEEVPLFTMNDRHFKPLPYLDVRKPYSRR